MEGTVYLLHFQRPLFHAKHYMGFAKGKCPKRRIQRHRKGKGARLMEVIVEKGIDFECIRTWEGTRHLERKLKKHKNAPRLCPICNPKKVGLEIIELEGKHPDRHL